MARLPIPGGDIGNWGEILNDFLSQTHNSDGSLKNNAVSGVSLQDGGVSEIKLASAVQAKLNTAPSATDLGTSNTSSSVTVTSSTGNDATLLAATSSLAGVMVAADKSKLNGVASGATANATNVELRDRATHTGTQPVSTITGLETALDQYVEDKFVTTTNEAGLARTIFIEYMGEIPVGTPPYTIVVELPEVN